MDETIKDLEDEQFKGRIVEGELESQKKFKVKTPTELQINLIVQEELVVEDSVETYKVPVTSDDRTSFVEIKKLGDNIVSEINKLGLTESEELVVEDSDQKLNDTDDDSDKVVEREKEAESRDLDYQANR